MFPTPMKLGLRRWFKCRYCRNPKDDEGRFSCRTAFSSEQICGRAGHCGLKTHADKRQQATAKPENAAAPIKMLLVPKAAPSSQGEAAGSSTDTPTSAAPLQADAPAEEEEEKPAPPPKKDCRGLGWEETDKGQSWGELYKAYLYFVEGGPNASNKFTIEKTVTSLVPRARDCTHAGKMWQHGVQCCKPCHLVRTDHNRVAKNAILAADKIVHSVELLGKATLTKSDLAFLQHAIIERPAVTGNEAFGRLRNAVRIRIQLETSARKLPPELRGTSGEKLFQLVLDVYGQGKAAHWENSVVHHMVLSLLQKISGQECPHISAKLFAFGRALRHLHKPSYEFFRLNAEVGPHVESIRRFEAAKDKDKQELIIARTPQGLSKFHSLGLSLLQVRIYLRGGGKTERASGNTSFFNKQNSQIYIYIHIERSIYIYIYILVYM